MMDADAILFSPRLKVQRANRHIDELVGLTSPLSPSLYTLTVEPHIVPPNAKPTGYQLVYRPTKPVAETLALTIGDAVHNLRGALDHLCTGIVRTVNPKAQPHFPMFKIRKDLVSARALDAIETAIPNAKDFFLKNIRPENGPNEALWSFNILDNDDKHNLLVPTVALARIIGSWTLGTNRFTDCGSSGDANRTQNIIVSNAPITIQKDFETTVQVCFGKGGPFEDQPVIPTLTQISQVVTETLDAFDRLIRA